MPRTSGTRPKGNGPGWGGPARGASRSRIKPGDPDGIQAMSNDPDIRAKAEARAEAVRDNIFRLAMQAEREETQLAAGVAFLNRVEGMPVARNINANIGDVSTLSDAELNAIAARGRASIAAPEADPAGPDDLVH